MKNSGQKLNNTKVSDKNTEITKKDQHKKTIDDKSNKKDHKPLIRAIPNKGKLIPELENDTISNISKNVTASNNCETNLIMSDNLNQISKKTIKSPTLKDDQKELENMRSTLVQYHYMNALLDETYSKQSKYANVRSSFLIRKSYRQKSSIFQK